MKGFSSIYFIGIGGIGMSALARYFRSQGKHVGGYDKTPSGLTDALAAEGIFVHFDAAVAKIPQQFLNPDETLVVYTPAIPNGQEDLLYFQQNGFEVVKRAQLLGWVTEAFNSVAVAGTHGKTTTSTMTAHLLLQGGLDVSAFLGGISSNYNTNYLGTQTPEVVVAEADEFDRSFLRLNPNLAVITSTDPDHLDIYGSDAEIKKAYGEFAQRVKPHGVLLAHASTGITGNGVIVYGENIARSELTAEDIEVVNGRFRFTVWMKDENLGTYSLRMPGRHNVMNILAAIGVARLSGVALDRIRGGVFSFAGVKRRFEWIVPEGPVCFADDYAHHPAEIAAFISGLRELYPGKKITGIFQPHLYSRTRDFASGFSESLGQLDELILLPIYPARELPLEGVNSDMLLQNCQAPVKQVLEKEELIAYLDANFETLELVATIGAGDIDRLVPLIRNLILEKR